MKLGEELMKDKLDEFMKLRECVVQLTPKTVSSHESDLEDVTDIDYSDFESYKKIQEKLEAKQKAREEKKRLKKLEEEKKKAEEAN